MEGGRASGVVHVVCVCVRKTVWFLYIKPAWWCARQVVYAGKEASG